MARSKGFGYLPPPKDIRNLNFQARRAMGQIHELRAELVTPRKRAYNEGPLLDQGDNPYCVGYSARGFINAAPIMTAPDELMTPEAIYKRAQKLDEWPGEDYDGTSVNAGCKTMQEAGIIKSYVWFTTLEEMIAWMNGGYGTLVIGTNWYARMDDVDAKGFIQEPTSIAKPIGGHAYRLNWFDTKKQGFLVINSWGHEWGMLDTHGELSGRAYMSKNLAERLCFKEEGEVAAPTQVRIYAERL